MLTALGGWLDSRVLFETLPDGGLTIEEWKHRAALGRDHEVKVVYAGFLLPFGHRASLVKITERKFAPGRPDPSRTCSSACSSSCASRCGSSPTAQPRSIDGTARRTST